MRIIIVDDESVILRGETELIQRCAPDAIVNSFSLPEDALEFLGTHPADVAFLDFEMPQCHGRTLARRMKAICPRINIIFATAYSGYYEDAMNLRASGYLLKPLKEREVLEELENLRYPVKRAQSGLFVRAFGNFEVFFNGQPVLFRYQKTKELLAYLIDRQGAIVSRDELVTALWGGEDRHDSYFKQLQKDLGDTLTALSHGDLLVRQRGALGILMNRVHCDYFDWLEGRPEGLNAYRGEYMRQYDWAESTRVNMEGRRPMWD